MYIDGPQSEFTMMEHIITINILITIYIYITATVQIDIGRPVKFHLSLHRLDAILSTYQLILRKLGLGK